MGCSTVLSLLTFTWSKSTIEIQEKGVILCLNLTMKTPKRRHGRRSGVFIVNFEHVSLLFLMFLLLTLSK